MRPYLRLVMVAAALLLAAAGCSDDSTAPSNTQSSNSNFEGTIGDADFTITVQSAGDEAGPFTLTGSNLEYIDSLQALSVDLAFTNDGTGTHPEPVTLTFVDLIPSEVTVLNPDNGINGDGAAIEFSFTNEDSLWTPGESSEPRNVRFGVGPGQSIGFVGRLDIDEPSNGGGTISGTVWNDANEDGVMDGDEGGIEGVTVTLRNATDGSSEADQEATTDADGNYAFDGLMAGVYVVSKTDPNMTATTPAEITVLLTETDGVVSNFEDANFGCLGDGNGGGNNGLTVGRFVEVNGTFMEDPDRLVAQGVEVEDCGPHILADGNWDDDDDEGDCSRGKLRGPVTDIDEENDAIAIMGTWVNVANARGIEEFEIGDRLDVRVRNAENSEGLVAYDVKPWHNTNHDQVHGRIDEVETENGEIRLTVLGVSIVVGEDVDVEDDDDDDDDDDDV